jgi:hypothetical protein
VYVLCESPLWYLDRVKEQTFSVKELLPWKVIEDDVHKNIQPESNLKHLTREIIHLFLDPNDEHH